MNVHRLRGRDIELPRLARFSFQFEGRRRDFAAFDGSHARARVLEAIARLAVTVDGEPLLPAGVPMARRDLGIEIEPIAVFESHRALVNGLNAGTTAIEEYPQ